MDNKQGYGFSKNQLNNAPTTDEIEKLIESFGSPKIEGPEGLVNEKTKIGKNVVQILRNLQESGTITEETEKKFDSLLTEDSKLSRLLSNIKKSKVGSIADQVFEKTGQKASLNFLTYVASNNIKVLTRMLPKKEEPTSVEVEKETQNRPVPEGEKGKQKFPTSTRGIPKNVTVNGFEFYQVDGLEEPVANTGDGKVFGAYSGKIYMKTPEGFEEDPNVGINLKQIGVDPEKVRSAIKDSGLNITTTSSEEQPQASLSEENLKRIRESPYMRNNSEVQERVIKAISESAQKHEVDPNLIAAVIMRESRFNPDVPRGAHGEYGLMQVRPIAAEDVGFQEDSLGTIEGNIEAGTAYLGKQIKNNPDIGSALAAYNWGPGNVARSDPGNYPPSVQNYVDTVLQDHSIHTGEDLRQMGPGQGRYSHEEGPRFTVAPEEAEEAEPEQTPLAPLPKGEVDPDYPYVTKDPEPFPAEIMKVNSSSIEPLPGYGSGGGGGQGQGGSLPPWNKEEPPKEKDSKEVSQNVNTSNTFINTMVYNVQDVLNA